MNTKERDLRDYAEDIKGAADEIDGFIAGMDFEKFSQDRKTINAVIRSLEVMGEAAKQIPAEKMRNYPAIPWKSMVSMRDKLIHGYFGIDERIVWEVATKELPRIKKEIAEFAKGIRKEYSGQYKGENR